MNTLHPHTRRASLTDLAVAAIVGLATLGVYLRTIYPGLLDIGDATKFAFVGKVLGTPHAPGYPLYVVVSHLFSYLPWGTLAYRMNALSAGFGALAVSVGYLIARRTGAGRPAAVAAALALGLGQAFWATALYAKTYTLNAAIVSVGILVLLRWNEARRPRDLYWSIAVFALSLGNHLTVIALVPALVLFVAVTEPRTAFRPKTLAVVCLLVALGLTQYGFIILRTVQHAPYLEARASNVHELWAVMTARRFAHEIGAYSLSSVLSTRVPIVAGLIGTELGPIGLPFLVVGLAVLLVRQRRLALLLGLGALGVASLTANMSSEEDQGFLLSVFVLLWPMVGVGLQAGVDLVTRVFHRAGRLVTAGIAAVAVAALPCAQLAGNYAVNDHHTERFETDYFNALFAALPPKAAIVNDEYRINMLVLYKLLGERAGAGRDIRLAPLDKDAISQLRQSGFDIFAFQSARKDMEAFGFNFAPYEIPADSATRAVLRRRDIFRVLSTPTCRDVGNLGWMDISRVPQPKGRMNVRIDNLRPFDAALTLYAASAQALSPAVIAPHGKGVPVMDLQTFRAGAAGMAHALDAALSADQATLPDAWRAAPFITRAHVRVNDKGDFSAFALDLGGPVQGALGRATIDQDTPRRASVCSHPLEEADALPPAATRAVFTTDASNVQFDEGWFPTERRADGYTYRWTSSRAVLLVPIDHPRAATVTVDAEPLNYAGRVGSMTLVVNGHRLHAQPLPAARTTLSWMVPLADWRDGLNELVWEVAGATSPRAAGLSPDGRMLGVSVSRIELVVGERGAGGQ